MDCLQNFEKIMVIKTTDGQIVLFILENANKSEKSKMT